MWELRESLYCEDVVIGEIYYHEIFVVLEVLDCYDHVMLEEEVLE